MPGRFVQNLVLEIGALTVNQTLHAPHDGPAVAPAAFEAFRDVPEPLVRRSAQETRCDKSDMGAAAAIHPDDMIGAEIGETDLIFGRQVVLFSFHRADGTAVRGGGLDGIAGDEGDEALTDVLRGDARRGLSRLPGAARRRSSLFQSIRSFLG